MQNIQSFSGFFPNSTLGRAYSAPPPSTPPQTPQLHNGFPTSVVGRTTGTRNLIAFNKALVTL